MVWDTRDRIIFVELSKREIKFKKIGVILVNKSFLICIQINVVSSIIFLFAHDKIFIFPIAIIRRAAVVVVYRKGD